MKTRSRVTFVLVIAGLLGTAHASQAQGRKPAMRMGASPTGTAPAAVAPREGMRKLWSDHVIS